MRTMQSFTTKTDKFTHQPALFIMAVTLFFICGFITVLNSLLSPSLKQHFHLNYTQAMLVQFCFFLTYAVMSLPMSWLVNKLYYKRSILLGLAIIILGCLIFIPAQKYDHYPIFLIGLFVLAAGVVMLEVAANPLTTLIGGIHTASARLTFAQSANPFAALIAPLLIGHFIIHGDFIPVYVVIALAIAVVTFIVSYQRIQPTSNIINTTTESTDSSMPFLPWRDVTLIFGLLAMFVYVGAEIGAGSLLVNYLHLPTIANMPYSQASRYLSLYWGGIMLGRVIGGYSLIKNSAAKWLRTSAIINMLLLIVVIVATGHTAMWSLLALGLFNATMFPSIFALSVNHLTHAKARNRASGYLIMGIVGGAVIPEIQGYLADQVGLQRSFLLLIGCYVVIALFAQHIVKRRLPIKSNDWQR
ncbi:MAG: sugar MFS transporter [Gammaproteobacteria bacterium]|nr:sugar MFS transporter [Gammaproteobacteria bacterium]